jgi:hypothetical protein
VDNLAVHYWSGDAYTPISLTAACIDNDQNIVPFKTSATFALQDCFDLCGAEPTCEAVDFLSGSSVCHLYTRACQTPMRQVAGASSFVHVDACTASRLPTLAQWGGSIRGCQVDSNVQVDAQVDSNQTNRVCEVYQRVNDIIPTRDCAGFCALHQLQCVGAFRDVSDFSCARGPELACDDMDGLTSDHICQCQLAAYAAQASPAGQFLESGAGGGAVRGVSTVVNATVAMLLCTLMLAA